MKEKKKKERNSVVKGEPKIVVIRPPRKRQISCVASSRISFPLFQDFVYYPITNTSEIIK